jgi:hypothetical protein
MNFGDRTPYLTYDLLDLGRLQEEWLVPDSTGMNCPVLEGILAFMYWRGGGGV